jgi:hypothetical protein
MLIFNGGLQLDLLNKAIAIDWLIGCYMSSFAQPRPSRECLGPRAKGDLSPSSNSANNDTQTKSIMVCHKQGIKIELMNCDLENSFLLVYLSGPLITTHGPRGAAPAYPSQWACAQLYQWDDDIRLVLDQHA